MGGKSSREDSGRRSIRSSSSSYYGAGGGGYPQDPAPWGAPVYSPAQQTQAAYQNHNPRHEGYSSPQREGYAVPYPAPSTSYSTGQPNTGRRLERKYSRIADDYKSLDQVTEALAKAGLESSNLIVGIDFTKSNEWTGKISFNHQSLHRIGDIHNPYEQALSIIGRTLSAFDEDNLIPCFGFGDASTHDQDLFSFYADERPCNGFEEVMSRYRELVPQLRLAGPTSFAPIVEMAMTIVEQSGGQYHVLLIIADGQVTRSVDTLAGHLSCQEQKTVDAIVKASEFPLSIVLVGVGDGPWDMMKEFDDNIPARSFDNFQFVNFTEIMSKRVPQSRKETEFALAALMEIPSQYKATLELGILGHPSGRSPDRVPLPPPFGGYGVSSFSSKPSSRSSSFQQRTPTHRGYDTAPSAAPAPSTSSDNHLCPICLTNPKDMAFGCGHQTCCECGPTLETCPICRSEIVTRIRLY
uniref:E3 ubiquitin-protein ligase RGLG2 n=1 Tax=Anthurium amnicola TaxID=1678845 RepID=A0A1D1XIW8_9ARAE